MLIGALVLVSGTVTALGLAVLWVINTANDAPNINQLAPRVPGQTSQIFAANGESLGYLASSVVRSYVPRVDQPLLLRRATVAIEDRRFFQHGGVDYYGLFRAAIKDVFEGGGVQGGSTLAMQLVTNVYLPDRIKDQHNITYKIVQAKLANELEDRHTKQWVITQYLNDVPYGTVGGQTAIGVAAASQMFFNRPVERLDLAQAALLAGLPQAPSEYNPFLYPKLAKARRNQVLQAMAQSGYITKAQAQATEAAGLQVKQNNVYQAVRQPYVFDYVKQQLVQDLGQAMVDKGGLKVHTTIDIGDQEAAAAAIKSNEGYAGDPAAALVSINPSNGHILALQNSTSYGTGPGQTVFDYATQGARQPGSSFKVFVLMDLIHDQDGNPNDTYYNSHFLAPGWLPTYPTYSVHTAENGYEGDISVTKATALSDNTVFAQLGQDLGMTNVDAIAHAMGVTSKLYGYPAEAIGGLRDGVNPLQMSDAYATLANGGDHIAPTIINYVILPNGKRVNFGNPAKHQVFTPGEAYEGTQTLQTVVQYGTGTAANYGCPVAGKTGTTSNYTDAWFVGYSPILSTAVWVGYPNGEKYMTDVNGLGPGYGGTLAAPIWRDFMQAASHGYCGSFPTPATYWTGVEYFGHHATSAYVPPPPPPPPAQAPVAPPPTTTTPPPTATHTAPPSQGNQPAQPSQPAQHSPPAQQSPPPGGATPPPASGGSGGANGLTGGG